MSRTYDVVGDHCGQLSEYGSIDDVLDFGANHSLKIESHCDESPNLVVSSHALFAEGLLWEDSTPLVFLGANGFRPSPPLLYHHHRKAYFKKAVM